MNHLSRLVTAVLLTALFCWGYAFSKSKPNEVVVRIAQLEIDPSRLDDYTRAVKEEMQDAVRLEPGVIAIYAVAEKDNPTRLHFFEIYASEAAYAAHRETPHFRKYLAVTQPMIRDRKLIAATPLQLSEKD
jgi:quinol monooxygenase YgiN